MSTIHRYNGMDYKMMILRRRITKNNIITIKYFGYTFGLQKYICDCEPTMQLCLISYQMHVL